MKVALYNDHHDLPFWGGRSNPYCLYEPALLEGWKCKRHEFKVEEPKPASEFFMIPVLKGLSLIEMPGIMAHVSLVLDFEKKEISGPKRIWVQITTEPAESDERGVPLIVKDGKVQVELLWGRDNGTYTPYDFLKEPIRSEQRTGYFWKLFFIFRLQEAKASAFIKAQEKMAEAQRILDAYSLIWDNVC